MTDSALVRSLLIAPVVEARLVEWGREYGGSRYENVGYPSISPLARIRDHHGFQPDSQIAKLSVKVDGAADEVERVVMALQRCGIDGFADALCLRLAYDPAAWTIAYRLRVLRAIGRRDGNSEILAGISERTYHRRKLRAVEYVAEALFTRRRMAA